MSQSLALLDALAFDPRHFPGLQVWFAARFVSGIADGGAVATWNDQSGNGFNATQGTGANQPLYKTNIVNGKPVLRFDGSVPQHLDLSGGGLSIFTSAPGITSFIVFNATTFAGGPDMFSASTVSAGTARYRSAHSTALQEMRLRRLDADAPSVLDSSLSDATSTWYVETSRRDYQAARSQIWRNGVIGGDATSGSTGNTDSTAAANIQIGAFNGGNGLSGDIAEVIAYNRALLDRERIAIERGLAAIYGIQWTLG